MNGILLAEFRSRVEEIANYWLYLTSAARLSEGDLAEVSGGTLFLIRQMNSSVSPGLRKTFDYSSIVVALYGAIEDFVERLVERCVDVINDAAPTYQSLPSEMRRQHERLSIRLSERIDHPSYMGPLNLRTIIDNLNGCLTGQRNFRLNREAFALHTANVRNDVIRDMFKAISIPNIDSAVAAHRLTYDLLSELGRSQRDAHFYINDLASRRNVVAHGERPYDVISVSMMDEYFRAVDTYGQALYESAVLGIFALIGPVRSSPLGSPTATYRSGRVVCFQPEVAFDVKIGSRILWQSQKSWKIAQIDSLQVNREALECYAGEPRSKIGLGISRNGNNKARYWLLSDWA
ncbi:MAE_28990/MAE_18760 family HEPN-like nuclease [Actinomadura sp. LOL_016]|uniref:MAE_28990/MAE_18760 family HEPN-like nuclease n=1 Tax=unclassified Actinomadura TaxID=2626254 RepID=UPI003A802166